MEPSFRHDVWHGLAQRDTAPKVRQERVRGDLYSEEASTRNPGQGKGDGGVKAIQKGRGNYN